MKQEQIKVPDAPEKSGAGDEGDPHAKRRKIDASGGIAVGDGSPVKPIKPAAASSSLSFSPSASSPSPGKMLSEAVGQGVQASPVVVVVSRRTEPSRWHDQQQLQCQQNVSVAPRGQVAQSAAFLPASEETECGNCGDEFPRASLARYSENILTCPECKSAANRHSEQTKGMAKANGYTPPELLDEISESAR